MFSSGKVLSLNSMAFTLLALGVLTFAACSGSYPPTPTAAQSVQTPCTLTYAAGTPSYVFAVGQFGSAQGGVLADGDCYGVGQSINPPLPGGLQFSVDRGGRRWQISGTPTETADTTRYTIQAKATIGSGPATQDTSRSIELRVEP